jgi:hypothetical protein
MNAILMRPTEPASWWLIGKMAEAPNGPIFLKGNTAWLDNAARNPKGALSVFLLLFQNPKSRRQLALIPQYASFLKSASALGEPEVLSAVSHIARKGEVNERIMKALSGIGFWTTYIGGCCKSPVIEVQENCMTVVDAFGRVGWCAEFGQYLKYLSNLFTHQQLAAGAIRVTVTLSYRKEAIPVLRDLKVGPYFQNLLQDPYYAQLAQLLLDNLAKA